jgi:hypothetical protein
MQTAVRESRQNETNHRPRVLKIDSHLWQRQKETARALNNKERGRFQPDSRQHQTTDSATIQAIASYPDNTLKMGERSAMPLTLDAIDFCAESSSAG